MSRSLPGGSNANWQAHFRSGTCPKAIFTGCFPISTVCLESGKASKLDSAQLGCFTQSEDIGFVLHGAVLQNIWKFATDTYICPN